MFSDILIDDQTLSTFSKSTPSISFQSVKRTFCSFVKFENPVKHQGITNDS